MFSSCFSFYIEKVQNIKSWCNLPMNIQESYNGSFKEGNPFRVRCDYDVGTLILPHIYCTKQTEMTRK